MNRKSRNPKPETRRAGGFALLDLLVSVLILGLFLVPLAMARNNVILLAGEAVNLRKARILAAMKAGEIELEDPLEMVSSAGDFGEENPGFVWETQVDNLLLKDVVELEEAILDDGEESSFSGTTDGEAPPEYEVVRVTITVRSAHDGEALEPESILDLGSDEPVKRPADRIVMVRYFLKEPEEEETTGAQSG